MPHNQDKHVDTVWPPLSSAYLDVYGPIDPGVYAAAGKLWHTAQIQLQRAGIHSEEGQTLMLRAVAQVTRAMGKRTEKVEKLEGYLWVTFRRMLVQKLEEIALHSKLDAEYAARFVPSIQRSEDEIIKIILMREIYDRADDWLRQVIEFLELGHTYEEIAEFMGGRANVIRSKFSKRIRKLANQIRAE